MFYRIISITASADFGIELSHVLSILNNHNQVQEKEIQAVIRSFTAVLQGDSIYPDTVWQLFGEYTRLCDIYSRDFPEKAKDMAGNNQIIQKYLDQNFSLGLDEESSCGISTPSYSDRGSTGSRGADVPPDDFLGVINPKLEGDNFLTLRYVDPPHRIEQRSQIVFGDKLYGNQENRDTLLPALRKQFGANVSYRDAFTIDEYNALLNIDALSLGGRDEPDFKLPEDHDIAHPQSIAFKVFSMRVLTEKGKAFTSDTHDRIKKSCKLGIDFVRETGQKIHFVLPDAARLDQEAIVFKTEGNGQSITASELRKIYREWGVLCQTVVFYREVVNSESDSDHSRKSKFVSKILEATAAPWETDAGRPLWSQYVAVPK